MVTAQLILQRETRIPSRVLPPRMVIQAACQSIRERVHIGRHHSRNFGRGYIEHDPLITKLLERMRALRVGAEEATVAGVLIIDQERRVTVRQPVAQQVVSHWSVLLNVVHDEVGVSLQQIIPADWTAPEMSEEDLDLEREVEQVMVQTVAAETVGANLGLFVDALVALLATPGGLEPPAYIGVRESDHSGLVQIVDNLTIEPVTVDGHALEVALIEQRAHYAGHIILRRLQREEGGRSFGMGKAGLLGDHGPEEIDHPLGQPADGGESRLAASVDGRATKRGVIRSGQCPLGCDDKNGAGRDAKG